MCGIGIGVHMAYDAWRRDRGNGTNGTPETHAQDMLAGGPRECRLSQGGGER